MSSIRALMDEGERRFKEEIEKAVILDQCFHSCLTDISILSKDDYERRSLLLSKNFFRLLIIRSNEFEIQSRKQLPHPWA
ncbi:MAG TPA: hypothetical protein VIY47_15560 [Ignavibacteriaceae bacterium]